MFPILHPNASPLLSPSVPLTGGSDQRLTNERGGSKVAAEFRCRGSNEVLLHVSMRVTPYECASWEEKKKRWLKAFSVDSIYRLELRRRA